MKLTRVIESAREAARRAGSPYCVVTHVGDYDDEFCIMSEREAKKGERAGTIKIIETVRA